MPKKGKASKKVVADPKSVNDENMLRHLSHTSSVSAPIFLNSNSAMIIAAEE